MKKPQRQLTTAITDPDQQVTSAAIDGLGEQHFTGDEAAVPRDKRAYLYKLRSVLVAQRQQEQHILNSKKPQLFKSLCERRTNAIEYRKW